MPWKSRWHLDIPPCSLPTYLFGSATAQLDDKPVIIDGEQPEYNLSLHSYREWSKRLAVGLKRAGFKPGDRLLLFSGNTIFFSVVQFATIMAGGIFTGANPTYVAREVAYQLKDSGATFFIVGEANLDAGLAAAKEVDLPLDRVFSFDNGIPAFDGKAQGAGGLKSWTSLVASPQDGASFKWEEFKTHEQMNRCCVLNYSSGTTGLPKGVELSHYNYVANCMQVIYVYQLKSDYKDWQKRARGIAFLPMYHAYGQTYAGINYPKMGVPQYLMRKFDLITLCQWIEKYKVTGLSAVPPIVVALTKRPEVKSFDLSSLEEVGSGAAPLAKETTAEFEAKFQGKVKVKQGWGMSEVTCSAMGWEPDMEALSGAVGELNPNVEAQIVDDNEKEVPIGERGELWVRGPNICVGYWRKPEETDKTFAPGRWLKTGDIAYRNEDGFLWIVDRKKELIKVKGLQVAPAELEGLLLDHPEVDDVAVVGVTINGDEAPRAYAVVKEGSKATPKEIAEWMAERVSRHKRLTGGVVLVKEIPKNPSGKLLRKELRERAAKEIGDGSGLQSKL
ncbi:unnamed protein product [Zymoseptoria tritici ST99CH_1A5]|uniref:4-coumarate-CoA ligase n=4 Tax=Zymoseptoria tritici TaxID=1047171 RepID=F9WWH5_ZYMTI|nr:uncharacterized protein MYCGRDRAFT_107133 [Zymoseptoria tritici IPO323]SMQ45760.1 unnamed protein product [Zymoseptoria tritici ST99CH_3D7]SMR42105.1 unnamed protein product [Zymoseptoria tritici ST99CH_1E4]SMR44286.1 unnamed protein product [Zymoseptoria tritici ST99CH_3D1]SMY19441.1 unnamed protein product [Zymoseptoria tritici ST99CH_1A5]EGP91201.1 hypothetical protein MYCGRDRAFT_107133 [Zymoseptoria tritici IPO323]